MIWYGMVCYTVVWHGLSSAQVIQITFLIALHFACSEKPVMLSGLHILMRGNSEARAILTARAVLPEPIGPEGTRMIVV